MKTAAAAIAVLFLAVAPAMPTSARPHAPTPSPSPPPADPAITKLARQQFVQWQAGVVDKNLYAPQLLAQLTDAKIGDTSSKLGELGALTETVYVGRWLNPDFPADARGYIYQMRCVTGNVYLWMALDAQGKIIHLSFKNRLDVENVTPSPSATPEAPLRV
ncbi:MAG: hypothetical protein JO104_03915 [Candidatus Eremiobacteraeota bacterium]|nr:hypothetical protein [Candidatus Eremiobacteraeota bacterium]